MNDLAIAGKPADLDALRELLLAGRGRFTPKMLAAGGFAIENPQLVALNPVSEVARIAGLAPTSFVRLAQAMGFAGYSEMQALFRAPLRRAIPPTLEERIRHAMGEQVVADPNDPAALGRSFAEANIAPLRHLSDRMGALPLEGAIDLITGARMIYVIGVDRSFPTAAYLSYALNRAGPQSAQITGLGRAMRDHARAMREGDLLIAISFPPYAPETVEVAATARAQSRRAGDHRQRHQPHHRRRAACAAGRGRRPAWVSLTDRSAVPDADAGDGGRLSPAERGRRARLRRRERLKEQRKDFDLIVRGGTVAITSDVFQADVAVKDGVIV